MEGMMDLQDLLGEMDINRPSVVVNESRNKTTSRTLGTSDGGMENLVKTAHFGLCVKNHKKCKCDIILNLYTVWGGGW